MNIKEYERDQESESSLHPPDLHGGQRRQLCLILHRPRGRILWSSPRRRRRRRPGEPWEALFVHVDPREVEVLGAKNGWETLGKHGSVRSIQIISDLEKKSSSLTSLT